jgi:hypothetical protein
MSIWENRRKLLMSGAIGRVAVRRLMGINVEDEAEVIIPAAEAPGKRENMPTKPLQACLRHSTPETQLFPAVNGWANLWHAYGALHF